MRHFLIILGCVIFFPAISQDTLVRIRPNTARYFLEADDKSKILEKKDSLNQQIITNLRETIDLKDQIITTYKQDSLAYNQVIENKDIEIELTKKEVRRQKRLKLLAITIGLLGIGLSL